MEKRLREVLAGQEDNYLLPFYWQKGTHHDKIPAQVEEIYRSGCRALCVESRTHEDFGGPSWWRDMDLILSECEKRGMKVWILDDKHFPTGYANGYVAKKYPEVRQWELIERHVDVIGPMKQAALLMAPDSPEEPLEAVLCYRRKCTGDDRQELEGKPWDLTANCRGNYLYWDVPEGCYRVFFLYRSHRGGHATNIDMISPLAGAVQIEAVYQPHFEHYARYFGNTIAGFFSDEPEFGNGVVGARRVDRGFYESRIGSEGMALPFNSEVLRQMQAELGEDARLRLGELWYESEDSGRVRLAYMNAVTRLFRDCFSRPVGNWCRDHGVQYIGHVIEDMNCHTRLGHGTGHYFRTLDGQDMSGMDIVLHQVIPGISDWMHTASCAGGAANPEFFHYVLGQMCASLAHIHPRMDGKAMCEVFGAFGWAEGTPFMRWLMDFLLVRGINRFVPHAFSPVFPNPDCPPHFGSEGNDPQFEGFRALMHYTNKAAHLLSGGNPVVDAAVLYHAEAEWMAPFGQAMLTEKPAKNLAKNHIFYDVLPGDSLADAAAENGCLTVGRARYRALIVPGTPILPEEILDNLKRLESAGLPVFFAEQKPEKSDCGRVVPLSQLAAAIRETVKTDLLFEKPCPDLFSYHTVREGNHVLMFFNESASETAETRLQLPVSGEFARLRLLEDFAVRDFAAPDFTGSGTASLKLLPGQSEIWVFGPCPELPEEIIPDGEEILSPTVRLEVADSENPEAFRFYQESSRLPNVTGPDQLPDFSGKMRYTFELITDNVPDFPVLDLGTVGQWASVKVNGIPAGIRISSPWEFPLKGLLRPGSNTVEILSGNTLAGRIRDHHSYYLQIPPSGVLGPLKLKYKK